MCIRDRVTPARVRHGVTLLQPDGAIIDKHNKLKTTCHSFQDKQSQLFTIKISSIYNRNSCMSISQEQKDCNSTNTLRSMNKWQFPPDDTLILWKSSNVFLPFMVIKWYIFNHASKYSCPFNVTHIYVTACINNFFSIYATNWSARSHNASKWPCPHNVT